MTTTIRTRFHCSSKHHHNFLVTLFVRVVTLQVPFFVHPSVTSTTTRRISETDPHSVRGLRVISNRRPFVSLRPLRYLGIVWLWTETDRCIKVKFGTLLESLTGSQRQHNILRPDTSTLEQDTQSLGDFWNLNPYNPCF